MGPLLAALVATLVLIGSAGAQPVADHLKCYKVKDPQTKATYSADLGGLVAEPGCTIKVPAVMACVPATKTNVTPAPPGTGGTGPLNAFGCYKVKCPKATLPALQLNDQFGTRVVTPAAPKLLCAPVEATTTTTASTTTTTTTTVPGCGALGTACVTSSDCCSNYCASSAEHDCTSNPCRDRGDAGAGCTDLATGYSCACSAGFVFNGISCVGACQTTDPCGNGGTCTVSGGSWTCSCPAGYVSSGGTYPTCIPVNTCSPIPSTTTTTTTLPGCAALGAACVNSVDCCSNNCPSSAQHDCASNPCRDRGDAGAGCTDLVPPGTGYSCACSAGFVFNAISCVGACPTTDPCGDGGTCTVSGGGWTCSCPAGYVSSGGTYPSCVPVNACSP